MPVQNSDVSTQLNPMADLLEGETLYIPLKKMLLFF